jgi:hypothetical protein
VLAAPPLDPLDERLPVNKRALARRLVGLERNIRTWPRGFERVLRDLTKPEVSPKVP